MAITFFDSATNSSTNGGNLILTLPASMQQDDIVVLFAAANQASGTLTGPGGTYTRIGASNISSGTVEVGAWYKFMGASPDTSATVVVASSATTDTLCALSMVFRGVDTATPLDVAATTATGTSTNPDPAAIVPLSDDTCIVVGAGSGVQDATPGTVSGYSTPVTVAANDSNDTTLSSCYLILTGNAGVSQDPAAFSGWASGSWGVHTVALRPLAPVAGQPYDLHEGGVPFVNPHFGGQNFQVW
jgi:hypothetical protein